MTFKTLTAMFLAVAMIAGTSAIAGSAEKMKDRRSQMTEAQKKELRKRAREWCMKNHVKGQNAFERVEILSDGRVRCWVRSR